jgi:hypothetical protein
MTSSPGLVKACDAGEFFAFSLWPKQRKLLRAVEKGPRGHVWALGRRSGKTTMAALVGLWDCLLRPELDGLVRPGERRYSVCVATNLRQARLYVSAARSIVEASPLLARHLVSATDDELAFANQTVLAAFPCTSRGARGWPISSLLLDEAAHHVDTEGNQAGPSVWQALYPSTAQFGDKARIIVSSTPYGQDGFFADRFELAASHVSASEHATAALVRCVASSRAPGRQDTRIVRADPSAGMRATARSISSAATGTLSLVVIVSAEAWSGAADRFVEFFQILPCDLQEDELWLSTSYRYSVSPG